MSFTRRTFFAACGRSVLKDLSAAMGVMADAVQAPPQQQERERHPQWLRPPGALSESAFLKVCTRCTACQEACPHQSIRRLGPEFGTFAETPAIIADESPCYLCEDLPCITACSPGALRTLPRSEVAMGTAVISLADCYLAQSQPCDYCVTRCPIGVDAVGFGGDGLPEVNELGCTGCGVCAYLCPAQAIVIHPRHDESQAISEGRDSATHN